MRIRAGSGGIIFLYVNVDINLQTPTMPVHSIIVRIVCNGRLHRDTVAGVGSPRRRLVIININGRNVVGGGAGRLWRLQDLREYRGSVLVRQWGGISQIDVNRRFSSTRCVILYIRHATF